MMTGNVGIFKLDKRSYGVMIESDVKMTGNANWIKVGYIFGKIFKSLTSKFAISLPPQIHPDTLVSCLYGNPSFFSV